MAITVIDIEKKRGDTRRHTFIVKDSGVAVDISAWTSFVLSVHSVKDPVDATTELESMTGALSAGGTDGRCHFIPDGTLATGKHYYDVQALDSNGEKTTFAEGEYKVNQDRAKG